MHIYSLISIGICPTVQRLRNQLTSDQANGCSPTLSLSLYPALALARTLPLLGSFFVA